MNKGSIMVMKRSSGTLISCKGGNLWITEPGSKDIHLTGGDEHLVNSSGKIVIQAISECGFEIN
jgi:Protein of unknown function (DUF2917)